MIIKIQPLDTLFFRDGRPFGSSDDNWATSISYPNLSTIYGAIRSVYFSQNNLIFDLANEDEDPTKDLKINGIYFFDENEENLLFKVPQDLYLSKNNERLKFFKLIGNTYTNNSLEYIFQTNDIDIEKKDVFITSNVLKDYLEIFEEEFSFYEIDEFIKNEPKIGIGINKSVKNVEEGKLYRIGAKRYKNLSIIIDFDGIELKDEGLLKIGGEGKSAYYEKFDDIKLPKTEELSSKIFKTYLLTPSIFKNGWYPDFLDKNFEGEIDGVKVKLIAAALGKAEYIGGWDIKENIPKKMYKAVSSGSIYCFRLLSGNPFKINNLMSDEFEDYKKQGFGKVIIGDFKEEK